MTDFRLIRYKVVSKALTTRLKTILPMVISEEQSAFLPNRLIMDNNLLAFELVRSFETTKDGKQFYSALKLDMSKVLTKLNLFFGRK